ncbi:acylase [Shewanella eurypsychrophilus]|uniref:Acylase n=1 Tax=Shewanella eurypsychrophilus TaxID=2593656 RepID=A0ABX6V2W7_9GAMM|nr:MULTISPECIES: acylase [Shewanella]QFU20562.1 acylase [Shewanella sp. YLB-09]QFU20843.1 acylase [Shewanella sp. YLB-09]QPG56131.1 acylase [Shewanella eurypsychrophilus]
MENNKYKTYLTPIALAMTLSLSGCGGSDDDSTEPEVLPSTVKIEYTSFGVPHITASDYRSLGYGQAYAHAQENMCTLAEQIIEVRAQKAMTFGAGNSNANVLTDFGTLALNIYNDAEAAIDSMTEEQTDLLAGYAEGFNQAVLDKAGSQNYPSPCRGADWIPELSITDLHAYHLKLALFASGGALSNQIATASPTPSNKSLLTMFSEVASKNEGLGSNGWALGRDKTESGSGMLLSNPHFPWAGSLRFVENHLQIPGEINVTGVSFVGVPGVLIGFNENIAWTHTVSQSKRFTTYQLTLDPENNTRYLYDGEYREMLSQEYTIDVKNDDGTNSEITKTLYSSHYGPMIGWYPDGSAVSYRDANANNGNMVSQWLAMDRAKTIEEFEAAFETYQGIPWVNTMATDDKGNAFFIDGSRAPNLNAFAAVFVKDFVNNNPVGKALWQGGKGQLVLDGSMSLFEWVDTGTTPIPGVVPFEKAPKVLRSDYVFNANSSHWLNHVEEPLEGYSIVYGPEQTIRSPRTRMNATMLQEKSAQGISGENGKFNLDELKNVVMSQRAQLSELLKDQLVERCSGVSNIILESQESVDISAACTTLANWDGLYKNTSQGAHVFREFLKVFNVGGEQALSDSLFATAFNVSKPVSTPANLAQHSGSTNSDPVLQALASTVQHLASVNIPLAAPLGSIQYHMKNEEMLSIPGGGTIDGVFNINTGSSAKVKDYGYPVFHGASWLMALEFTDNGPRADAFLTYGQSHDPESDHFVDQTRLFSKGEWRPVVFTEQDIKADLVDTIELTLP